MRAIWYRWAFCAVQGHGIGLDKFYAFAYYGPAGPDAKPGTADDLADPFAPLLAAADAPPRGDGKGGLAGLAAEDVTVLREVRDTLQRIAADLQESQTFRQQALKALLRVHEALADWGSNQQAALYPQFAGRGTDLALVLAETHANGGQYHLGGACAFWAGLDPGQDAASGRTRNVLRQCERWLDKRRRLDSLRPLK